MIFKNAVIAIFAATSICAYGKTYQGEVVKVLIDELGRKSVVGRQAYEAHQEVSLQEVTYPQFIQEHTPIGGATITELRTTQPEEISNWLKQHKVGNDSVNFENTNPNADDVRTLVNSGPSKNRIDLVFMGDGYTTSEREKFFADMQRLVNDMFVGQTFTAYLPLFNVHAVFRASNKSGIGKGSAIDTAYGLYREGETLRAIFPSKESAIRSSCNAAPGCDYPVVIANDPYYGGLGGEFAISTSSERSGTVVLRHELGHNFGRVGEEYDGGGYFGANTSSSATNLSWAHWATEARTRAEPAFARYIKWPWHKLDKGAYPAYFNSDGRQSKATIRFSASGIETDDTLQVRLDGKELDFESPNRTDRSFVRIEIPPQSSGRHKLEFSEHVDDHNNWLSDLTIFEYSEDFHGEPGFIGAFPVFTENLRVDGYRPTNETCLMRNMESTSFCPVCQENNWFKFFAKISLIDDLNATVEGSDVRVSLSPLRLGQFRNNGTGAVGEALDIKWFDSNGREIPSLAGMSEWTRPRSEIGKSVEARVAFTTSQIRLRTIQSKQSVSIP